MDIKRFIRDIPDFPKPGILFKDITPLLKEPGAFAAVIDSFASEFGKDKLDAVAGIESRGFIFGSALALSMGIGFIPIRKPGKLPYRTRRRQYSLEYGTDAVEIHEDAVKPGERILLVDDLIATGGTAKAAAELLKDIGADLVALAFVVELTFLKGVDKFGGDKVFSLMKF